jgi:mono/diheme cytochrome c family protein
MKLTTMKRGHIVWILPALLTGVFLIVGCGNARDNGVMAQPLTLATPASSSASGTGGITLPEQIVVVVVTPTAAQDAVSQQSQNQGNQPASQGGEGQAVAQAQPTAPPEGGQAGGEQVAAGQAQEGQAQEGQAGDQELISMGEPIYMSNCAACHQPSGEGISNYPPLAGSPIVTAEDPTAAIETVVNGRGQMPAFGGSLSADEIAAVLSYVRNSWGNSASVVTADQVSQIQGGGTQAGGAAGEAQATPAAGTQVTSTVEAQAPPAAGTQVTPTVEAQVTPAGEAQATPMPEAGSTEQAAGAAQVQVAPVGTGTQISVTQGQAGNVITIRIEIVIVTPEAAAASPSDVAGGVG